MENPSFTSKTQIQTTKLREAEGGGAHQLAVWIGLDLDLKPGARKRGRRGNQPKPPSHKSQTQVAGKLQVTGNREAG